MKVEEFASVELINKVRHHLNSALIDIGVEEGFRKDRLLTELTKEIVLSFM